MKKARTALGTVSKVLARNDSCRARKRKGLASLAGKDCTRYIATVSYVDRSQIQHNITIDAGMEWNHNQPVSVADKKIGQEVHLLYDPDDPKSAYEEGSQSIWGVCVVSWIFTLVFGWLLMRAAFRGDQVI